MMYDNSNSVTDQGSKFDVIGDADVVRSTVMVLVDTSTGASLRAAELNAALGQIIGEITPDEVGCGPVDLLVITMGEKAKCILPFTPAEQVGSITLDFGGALCAAEAFDLAHRECIAHRQRCREEGISGYRPWGIVLTDNASKVDWNDFPDELNEAAERGKVLCIAVGINGQGGKTFRHGHWWIGPLQKNSFRFICMEPTHKDCCDGKKVSALSPCAWEDL